MKLMKRCGKRAGGVRGLLARPSMIACVIAGAGLAVGAPVAGAAGGWSSPKTLSAPGVYASTPDLAMNQAGNAIVTWQARDLTSQAVLRPAGGAFSRFDPTPATGGVWVAMDGASRPMFVWLQDGRVQAMGGGLPAAVNVSSGMSGFQPHVVMNEAGDAVVIWHDRHSVLWVTLRPVGGSFSAPKRLGSIGREFFRGGAGAPTVAISKAGAATIVWVAKAGKGHPYVVRASVRSPGGGFSSPKTVARGGRPTPILAMNDAGGAVIFGLKGNRIATRGTHGKFRRVKPSPCRPLAVAMDRKGNALLACLEGATSSRVRVVRRSRSGKLSKPVDLGPRSVGMNRQSLRVVMNGRGDATLVWIDKGIVRAVTRRAGHGFSKPAKVSVALRGAFSGLDVGMDKAGNAIAGWAGGVGADPGVVQAAVRPAP